MVGRVVKYENILFLLFKYLKRFFWKYFQECNQTSKKKTFSSKIFLVENNLHYKILFYNEKKKMEPKDPFDSIKKVFLHFVLFGTTKNECQLKPNPIRQNIFSAF